MSKSLIPRTDAGGLAQREAARASVVQTAYEALLQRRGAEALQTAGGRSHTGYTYLRCWVDFAAFLRYRLGFERAPITWSETDASFRRAETDGLLELLEEQIGAVGADDVNAYRVAMLNRPARSRDGAPRIGLSHATINLRLAALRHLFKHAVRMHRAESNPALPDYVDRHRLGEPDRARGLTLREARRLLEGVGRGRDAMIIAFMLKTGARRTEIARLRFEDLGHDDIGMTAELHRKGDIRQRVLLPEELEHELEGYLREADIRDGPVFPAMPAGGHLSPATITKIVRKATAVALGRAIGPHALRRTFATRALDGGAPLHEVQSYLGHASPTTTVRYRDATLSRERSAAEFVTY